MWTKKILKKSAESKAKKRKLRRTISQIAKNSQSRWLKTKEKVRGKIEWNKFKYREEIKTPEEEWVEKIATGSGNGCKRVPRRRSPSKRECVGAK